MPNTYSLTTTNSPFPSLEPNPGDPTYHPPLGSENNTPYYEYIGYAVAAGAVVIFVGVIICYCTVKKCKAFSASNEEAHANHVHHSPEPIEAIVDPVNVDTNLGVIGVESSH